MDIGRTILMHDQPRRRLDAGTFGTMGIGLPFCIAAKSIEPESFVVGILGDSAFGFSGMEIETATRYKLPMLILIINNNGIYSGVESLPGDPKETPVTALNPSSRYEKLAEAFGGEGFYSTSTNELNEMLPKAIEKVK